MVFFSDHGEEVFESMDFEGHTDMVASKPMFTIPFIVWRSSEYTQKENSLIFDKQRPYCTDDLIYTMADLARIQFDEFTPKRSLVNAAFESKVRMVVDSIDFDKTFVK